MEEELERLKALVKNLTAATEPIEADKAKMAKEESDAYQSYLNLKANNNQKRKSLDDAYLKIRQGINRAEAEIRRAERKLEEERLEKERLEREAAEQAKRDALTASWDKLTMGAPWREWAKDHQIAAGHFISAKRKVILADPMGLGKTLSSIITCDMAEAITRDASIEFPKFGTEGHTYKYYWIPKDTDKKSLPEYDMIQSAFVSKSDTMITDDELYQLSAEERYKYESVAVKVPTIIDGVERPVGRKILYLCPSSLIRNVMKEFQMWTKHRNVTYVGGMSKNERKFAFDFVLKGREDYVVICNYEAWRKDLSLIDSFVALNPDTIIIDEAHNVKEIKKIGHRGIKDIIDRAQPEYVIPMTGTPILNRPQELFALLNLVNPKRFHTESDFLYNFCEQDDAGRWQFQPGGLDRVASQIGDNFLRRTKAQAGIVLPEKTLINHDLVLDTENYPKQAQAREQMRKYMTLVIDETEGKAIAATAIIAMYTRLRQIETWPAGIMIKDPKTNEVKMQLDVEESQKVDYVISSGPDDMGSYTGLIPEIIDEERIVLFSQFKAPLREIKSRIERAGYSAIILDGETPVRVREQIANDFDRRYTPDRSKATWDVVLCNYKVGGVGLNLTSATQLIVLDEEWNPGKRDQAYDRIHRIGQTDPVTIHVIRNQNTIDDWLAGIMQFKEGVVDGFDKAVTDAASFKDALDSGLI